MFPCEHTLLHTVTLNYIDFKLVASGDCLAIGAVLANVGFHMHCSIANASCVLIYESKRPCKPKHASMPISVHAPPGRHVC